jgi:ABC-type antimicrobial peptide transport system permease subunit
MVEIELLVSGSGFQILNGRRYSIQKGSLWITRPQDFHEVNVPKGVNILNIQFKPSILSRDLLSLLLDYPNDICIQLSEEDFSVILHTAETILEEHELQNDFSDLINLYIAPYAVYLNNDDKVDNIVDGMNDFGFYAKTLDSEKVVGVSKLLSVFTVFFEIVYIIVYGAIVILLFINTLNNIKKNYYEIGIMNALGVRNKDIRSIYVRNIITLGILIFIINYALSPVILYFADQILKIGFANLLDTSFIELRLIDIFAAYKRFDIVVVYITLFISLGLSNIKLSLLKPIELINEINKEV